MPPRPDALKWRRPPQALREALPPPHAEEAYPEFRPITGNRIDLPTIPKINRAKARPTHPVLEPKRSIACSVTLKEFNAVSKTAYDLGLTISTVFRLALLRFLRDHYVEVLPDRVPYPAPPVRRKNVRKLFREAERAYEGVKQTRRMPKKMAEEILGRPLNEYKPASESSPEAARPSPHKKRLMIRPKP